MYFHVSWQEGGIHGLQSLCGCARWASDLRCAQCLGQAKPCLCPPLEVCLCPPWQAARNFPLRINDLAPCPLYMKENAAKCWPLYPLYDSIGKAGHVPALRCSESTTACKGTSCNRA